MTSPRPDRKRPNKADVTALHQVQVLDPLGRPVGRNGRGRHPPDLFGVRLEEDLEEHAAEAVDDPVLDAPLGLDRRELRLDVGRADP